MHVVVGGGAAGYFGAIACAEASPQARVILLEKTRQPLAKVRISGGGRCNVTHACFDPSLLIRNYPRGSQELRGPFARFQPKDTVQWFQQRGVQLKAEDDGRMFPVTDQSETIIRCLQDEAAKVGVETKLECGVQAIQKKEGRFHLELSNNTQIECDSLLMATGSTSKIYPLLQTLGHTVVPLVPSLFTFNMPESPLLDLAGISLPSVQIKIPEIGMEQTGPLLITHWGFSGPAVLRLSAWGARELHALDYSARLWINWLPEYSEEELRQKLLIIKEENSTKQMGSESFLPMPKQLWRRLIEMAGITLEQRWSQLAKKQLHALVEILRASQFAIKGKTTYKQEFVTCGGISLNEVDFKKMESRVCPGLYFAGEILNIDGITGGFNFQNAWTTGWIAGKSMTTKTER